MENIISSLVTRGGAGSDRHFECTDGGVNVFLIKLFNVCHDMGGRRYVHNIKKLMIVICDSRAVGLNI